MANNGDTFRAALVQMRSGRSVDPNLASAEHLIRDAAGKGADYVQTPENTAIMELDREQLLRHTEPQEGNRALTSLCGLATSLRIWLHIGGMVMRVDKDGLVNRSVLIRPDGNIAATYDKMHMFDVDLPGGESYRESATYRPGTQAVIAELPWGLLGMTICYDLRFAHLYRALAQAGAQFLTVPAAFTKVTGQAHWHVLLRARAIETGCFVFAAAQGGHHEVERDTFGHSLIIDPWGAILAEAGTDPCVITADIDPRACIEARRRIPALKHDKSFELVHANMDLRKETAT